MMRKAWLMMKFVGRWLGPALILIAVYLFFFPPGPFGDASKIVALAGAAVTAMACTFTRAPNRRKNRGILAVCALIALIFSGWRYSEGRSGYHEEAVSFDNRGAHLVGTIYLPNRPGKVAAIVLLTGSGAIPASFFHDYAAHFARAGYAVLLYDKRGVGKSSGRRDATGFLGIDTNNELLADDASAALSLLAARREVRPKSVGFVGISHGGLIAPRAAVLNGSAAFMLIITSATTTLHEIVRFQNPAGFVALRRAHIKDFDPMPSLRILNIPGLWLMGDSDSLVPNEESIGDLESLRRLGKPYEYRVIPGAWHALSVGPKSLVLNSIDEWLAKVTVANQ